MYSDSDCAHRRVCHCILIRQRRTHFPGVSPAFSVSFARLFVSGAVIWGLIPETVEESGKTVEVPHSPLESCFYFPFHSDLCTEAAREDYENQSSCNTPSISSEWLGLAVEIARGGGAGAEGGRRDGGSDSHRLGRSLWNMT